MRSTIILTLAAAPFLLAPGFVSPAAAQSDPDEETLRGAKIATDGPGLLEFFRRRTVDGADEERLKKLVAQLSDEDFDVRERASAQLVAVGARARPALTKASSHPDVEVARRAKECLHKIDQGVASMTVAAAARALARRKPDRAAEVLLAYLPSAEDETVAEAVREALGKLALADGKADPALVKALGDGSPLKRAAAGVAFCRAKAADQLPAVRKLLQDSDPVVRTRVALALAGLREKEALPVLIDHLGQPPEELNGAIEDLLYRLADDKAPSVPAGRDDAGRRKYREAWKAWWTENGGKLDLAKLEEAGKTLGYTMVVLLDKGKIIDLDNANKPRWEIDGLEFPLDAQMLPGDRVLVAEHNGGKITERNKKNEVLWEKKVDGPLVAQRLPNGGTFICTRTHLLELDKDGKEVFNYASPRGEQLMKAVKLRNGDYAYVGQLGTTRYVRLSPERKELATFGVDVRTSGGRLDVLANGHVIIPENGNNRVVEYDTAGRVVWEAGVEQPIAATRLPNGNTLVTSMNQLRAVELDRTGKEVWQYKSDTRVTRAFRR